MFKLSSMRNFVFLPNLRTLSTKFSVWRLSDHTGSWDSGHRLCTFWPVIKSSERLLHLSPESQGRHMAHLIRSPSMLRSQAWLAAYPHLLLADHVLTMKHRQMSLEKHAATLQNCVQSWLLACIFCLLLPSTQPSLKKDFFFFIFKLNQVFLAFYPRRTFSVHLVCYSSRNRIKLLSFHFFYLEKNEIVWHNFLNELMLISHSLELLTNICLIIISKIVCWSHQPVLSISMLCFFS